MHYCFVGGLESSLTGKKYEGFGSPSALLQSKYQFFLTYKTRKRVKFLQINLI